jgi:RNA polymerase-binding transcription factor DksA
MTTASPSIPYSGGWRRGLADASFPQNSTMARKTPLTATEIKELKAQLLAERADLQAQYLELEESSFGSNQSELTGEMAFDEEYADAGSATFERERDLSLVGNLADLITKIQGALERIDDGSYGRCEVCGQPIEAERLDALPYTTLCLADARRRARAR